MKNNQIRILGLIVVGMLLILGLPTSPVQAANFTASDEASLVTAINNANANADFDTIELTANINLATTTTYAFNGTNGLPIITKPLAIIGNGYTIRRTSATQFRLLGVNATQLWLENITLAGGNVVGSGGAIYASGTNAALTLVDVTVGGSLSNENIATASGGAIYIAGNLSLSQSVISYNKSGSTGTSSGMAVYVNGTTSNTVIVNQTEIAYNQIITSSISSAGALSIENANTSISDSWIHHNSSPASGSGIRYNGAGLFAVYGSRVEYNSSVGANGGGIHATISNQAIIYGSVISNNVLSGQAGTYQGGGIYLKGSNTTTSSAIVENSIINNNDAGSNLAADGSSSGGGIAARDLNSFRLINSQVSNNYVSFKVYTGGGNHGGGGVSIYGVATSLIENTTISGNHTQNFWASGGESRGGGLLLGSGGSHEIKSSTISNNIMQANAGGAFGGPSAGGIIFEIGGGTARISNTIIAGNFGLVSGVYNPENCYRQGGSPQMTVTSGGYNLIQTDGSCESTINDATDIDVSSVSLGTLANNGGLSFTHAINTNPPIESGNPLSQGSYVCSPTDQRGAPRVGRCDIGAYEAGGLVPPANQAPNAGNDLFSTATNTAISALLSGNDSDPENQALTYSLASLPDKGSVSLNADSNFTYTPMTGYSGSDSFSYIVCDSLGECRSATVTIAVNTAITMPAAPTLSLASVGGQVASLSWVDNSSDETRFVIERRLNAGIWSIVGNVAANSTSFADSGLNCVYTYNYRVRAYRASDGAYSAPSNIVNATTTVCPAPSNFAGTAAGYQSIELSWDDTYADETSFRLDYSSNAGTSWNYIANLNPNMETYTHATGLTCGTSYLYRIRVERTSPSMTSAFSTITASTAACPPLPLAPTNLISTQETYTSIRLVWEDNATDEAGYRIERSANGGATFENLVTTSANSELYVAGSLACGTSYQFRVRTHRTNPVVQYSDPSNTLTVSTTACPPLPDAPSDLTATGTSDTTIQLNWTDNATSEANYRIERSPDGTSSWTEIALIAADSTSYSSTGLTCVTTYYYRVRASNAAGSSSYSPVVAGSTLGCAPNAPSGLASAGSTRTTVTFSWVDNSSNETAFYIERSDDDGVTWAVVGNVPANTTTYTDTGLYCNIYRYDWRVRAYRSDANAYSAYSPNIGIATQGCANRPTAPTNLVIDHLGSWSLELRWTDTASNETNYFVEQNINGTWTRIADLPANSTSYIVTNLNLSCIGTKSFRIAAFNNTENSLSNPWLTTGNITMQCPPADFEVELTSQSSARLHWLYASLGTTSVRIERSLDGGASWQQIGSVTVPGNWTFVDSTLSCGMTAQYRARGFGNGEYSDYTEVLTATTLDCYGITEATCIMQQLDTSTTANWTTSPLYISGDGQRLATLNGYSPEGLNLYDLTDGSLITSIPSVIRADIDFDGSVVTFTSTGNHTGQNADGNGEVFVWNNGSISQITQTTGSSNFSEPQISDDGSTIVFSGASGILGGSSGGRAYYIWDAVNGLRVLGGLPSTTTSSVIAISGDGTTVAFQHLDSLAGLDLTGNTQLYVWDAVNGARLVHPFETNANVIDLTLNYDGSRLLFVSNVDPFSFNADTSNEIFVWDEVTGLKQLTESSSSATNWALGMDGSGQRILLASTLPLDRDDTSNPTGYYLFDEGLGFSQLTFDAKLGWPTYGSTVSSDGQTMAIVYPVNWDGVTNVYPYLEIFILDCSPDNYLPAPDDLTSDSNGTTMSLSWDDNSLNETEFILERSDDGSSWTEIATLPANTLSYDDTIVACTEYQYRVRAHRTSDDVYSDYSNIEIANSGDTCPPDEPTNLTVDDISETEISLGWTDNATDESEYRLFRSEDGGENWTEIAQPAADSTSYIDSDITCGTSYDYRIRAYRLSDDSLSAFSNTVTATTDACPPPAAPTVLNISATSHNSISLGWTDNASDETTYRIERSTTGGSTWFEIGSIAADSTSYTDSSLTCAYTYYYRVRVYRLSDEQFSAYSNVATTKCAPPATPTNLQVSSNTQTSIVLSWIDNATNEYAYQVERSTNGGTTWTLINSPAPNSQSYTNTSLTCGTTYHYRVRNYRLHDSQNSAYSDVLVASTLPCSDPVAPINLNVTLSGTTASMSWTDASSNETSFRIERSTDGGTSWTQIASVATNTTSYIDSSPTCFTEYRYRVRAHRSSTNSYSIPTNTVTVTTGACALLFPPSNIASQLDANNIFISWDDINPNETNFRIERSSNGGISWTEIGTTLPIPSPTGIAFTDMNTVCATSYQYRVRAYRAADNSYSDYSAITSIASFNCATVLADEVCTFTPLMSAELEPGDLRLSGDGQRAFVHPSTNSGDEVQIWDLNSNTMIASLPISYYGKFAVDEDGSRVVFTSNSNLSGNNADGSPEVFLWDNGSISQLTDSALLPFTGYADFSISSDGTKVSFLIVKPYENPGPSLTYEIGYWEEGLGLLDILPEASQVMNLAMSGDGNKLAFSSYDALVPEAVEGEPRFYFWDAVNGLSSIEFPSEYDIALEKPETTHLYLDETGTTMSFRLLLDDSFIDVYLWNATDGFVSLLNDQRPPYSDANYAMFYDNISGMSADGQRLLLYSRYDLTGENPDFLYPGLGANYSEYFFVENGEIRQITSTLLLDWQPVTYAMSDDGSRILIYTQLPQPTSPGAHAASDTYIVIGDCEPLPLATPTGLTVDSADENSLDLSWNNDTYGETEYRLERSTDGGTSWTEIAQPAANSTSYSDTDLACATEYDYRLRAYRAVDTSYTAYTNVATGTTEDCLPPDAPTALSVTDSTEDSISLEWTDNASDETEYSLERSDDGGTNWTEVAQPDADSTSYIDNQLTCATEYDYRLRAYREADEAYSEYSNVATGTTETCPAPLAPTALTVTETTESSVSLSWADNADDETEYRLERSDDAGTSWTEIAQPDADSISYTDNGLTCATEYDYRLRAYREGDEQYSDYSNVVTAETLLCAPLAPTDLTVSSNSHNSISLSWTDNAEDETHYFLERSSDGISYMEIVPLPADSTGYTDGDLNCTTVYYYRVRAGREIDQMLSDYSNVAAAACAAPLAPTALTVSATSHNSISLSWTDSAANETSYRVEVSTNGGANWTILSASLPADSTSYTDTDLSCNISYEYRVRANRFGDSQNSDYSNVVTATCAAPLAPTVLTVIHTSETSLELSWADNAVNETAYHLERSDDAGASWAEIVLLPADSSSYINIELDCDTGYQYRLRAYRLGDAQYSTYSNVATGMTDVCPPPAAPTALTVTANSHNSISLSWTDNANDETEHRLERSTDAGSTWTEIAQPAADATSYGDTGLSCNTSYQYRLRVYRAGDSQYSEYSNVVAATCAAPLAPTTLAVSATSHNSISLSWTDNATNETSYRVEVSTNGGANWIILDSSLPADSNSYTDSDLSCNISYQYRVRANRFGDSLNSDYSNVITATCAAPLAPSVLSIIEASETSISLEWTDNAVNETAYHLERSDDAGTIWAEIVLLPADSNSYINIDLDCNTGYQYRLRAYRLGDSQYSEYSNVATGTTELCPPAAPTVLTVTDTTENSISLEWTDNATDETEYRLERSDDGISWTEIAQPAADATSYSDTGLSCNMTYDYRLRAYRADDEQYSAYSNVVTETTDACPAPTAPNGLTVTGTTQTTVSLSWTDNAGDETSYSLERSLDGLSWVEVQALAANATSHSDTGLSCNTNYQYRIRAYRSGDAQFSAYSNVATGTTSACPAPLAPTALNVTGTSSNSVSLAWTDNSTDETQYRLERSADAGTTWTEIAQPAANATSYSDTTALCNTSYDYRIRAYRAGDNQFSDYSNVATGTTDICITLNAPTDIQLTASTETSLSMSWTDNSTNESGYEVERSLDGTNWTLMSSLPADSTSYTDSGLTCSTGYQYRVRSQHLGSGTYSAYATSTVFTTVSCPALVASVLSSTGSTTNSISLSWTVDSSGTSFTLAYYNGAAWVNLGIFPASTTTYTHTGLSCGTSYPYQVTTLRAGDGASVTSSAFSTSTAACAPLAAPNAPVVLNTEPALVSLQIPAMPATATSMSLERSTDGVSWANLGNVSSNYIDTAVICGSSYQYRLVATRSSDGVTSTSATALALTDACPIPTVLGVYRGGLWVFVDSNNTASPVNSFNFGDSSWQPLVGDWDGDGIDGVGIYRNGEFALRNIASADSPENRFNFGNAEAGWQAIVGDWDGNGTDTVGLYKDGLFILSNDNANIQYRFNYGYQQAGWQAIAGDWDGNGADGIGLYKDGMWMLAEDVNNPDGTSIAINYGPAQAGWTAIVGDWNGDGRDSIGLYSNGLWRMRVSNIHDTAENSVSFGQTGDIPLAIFEN